MFADQVSAGARHNVHYLAAVHYFARATESGAKLSLCFGERPEIGGCAPVLGPGSSRVGDEATVTCTRELNEARRGKYQILGTRYLQISREAVRIQRACFSLIVAVLFCVRPANLWRTLWQFRFVFWLSAGRSGRI
jgi:hypothetical protein